MPGSRTRRTREVDRYIGSRLRHRRTMLGMTQGELAKQVGLAFQQIQKYENGTDRISASRLFECAEVLDVPFGWFVAGARSALGRTAISRHPGNLALHRAMNQVTEPGCRTALKNLARVLAKGAITRARHRVERIHEPGSAAILERAVSELHSEVAKE